MYAIWKGLLIWNDGICGGFSRLGAVLAGAACVFIVFAI